MDARDAEAEAAAALRLLREAGVEPEALLPVARRDFKTRASRTLPGGEVSAGALVEALRAAKFPGRVGAGTPSHFTEFNRNPPDGDPDFVFFGTAATIHAADDLSAMETLEVFPELAASARALCPGKDIWLGPSTLGIRHNPYGPDVLPNPEGRRVALARFDPRQASLFGAAFAAGAAAQAARSQVASLCLAALAGPFGLFGADGARRPFAAIQAELSAAAGAECFALGDAGLRGLAWRAAGGLRALLANTTGEDVEFTLPKEFGTVALIEPDAGLAERPADRGRFVLPAWRTAVLS